MDPNIEKFFIPGNEVKLTAELDYQHAADYIRAAQAFARTTYQSVYIIDYHLRRFLFASPGPLNKCGLTAERIMELSYKIYLDFVPEDEVRMLQHINRAGFEFFAGIPAGERPEWYITYDFHFGGADNLSLINHKLTPLELTSDGRIWLALCVFSAATHTEPGNVEMHRIGSSDFYEYNLVTRRWNLRHMPSLTESETAILNLSIQGFTIADIAGRLNLSTETIKKYRQRLFEKLEVHNISEAIVAATNSKLL